MLLVSILAAAAATQGGGKPMTIVENGHSDYVIVSPTDALPAEKRAATELQHYIEKMSGAKLPIQTEGKRPPKHAIFVGLHIFNRPMGKLGEDGFYIIAGDGQIVLTGLPRGTMYAAYTLLDQLGCRWWSADAEFVPHKPTITVPEMDVTSIPAFEYREPYLTEAWDKDWAARNRTNGNMQKLDDSTGGHFVYYPFVHSFSEILPPDKFFDAHPEYFSEVNGKRMKGYYQLCLTNPDALKLTIAKVEEWIKEHPDAKIISVSQNDTYGFCTCPECKKVADEEGAQSGPLLRFVNAVGDAIAKDHPNVLIDTLAYQWSEQPPLHVKPHPNVRVRMAPIGNCFGHPIDRCEPNKKPYANLLAWAKITDQLYIWHYNTDFAAYWCPFPDYDELQGSTRVYKSHGVKGIFYEGAYPPGGGEMGELRSWVLAKLLWDPSLDVWQLISEFCDGFYCKASGPIQKYLKTLHTVVKLENTHFGIYEDTAKVGYLRRDIVDKSEALFEEAEKAVADDPAVLPRVQKARLAIDFTRFCQATDPAEKARYAKIVADKFRRFKIGQVSEGRDAEAWLKSIGQ